METDRGAIQRRKNSWIPPKNHQAATITRDWEIEPHKSCDDSDFARESGFAKSNQMINMFIVIDWFALPCWLIYWPLIWLITCPFPSFLNELSMRRTDSPWNWPHLERGWRGMALGVSEGLRAPKEAARGLALCYSFWFFCCPRDWFLIRFPSFHHHHPEQSPIILMRTWLAFTKRGSWFPNNHNAGMEHDSLGLWVAIRPPLSPIFFLLLLIIMAVVKPHERWNGLEVVYFLSQQERIRRGQ